MFTDPNEFLSTLKVDLYPEEVYTFTPKGKVFGAAAGIYSNRFPLTRFTLKSVTVARGQSERAHGSVRHKLHSGDIVEVITQPGHKPSPRLAGDC